MSALANRMRSALRRLMSIKALVVIALLLVLWVFIARLAGDNLIVTVPLDHADAIVVLSGSATYEERALKAASLYRAGVSRRIILTNDNRQGGWSKTEERNPYYYERARAELLSEGVSVQDIIVLQEPVYSTHDEAVLMRRQNEALRLQSMIVVTSAHHSRRALWIMEKAFRGTSVKIGSEPVPPSFQNSKPAMWWLHFQGWKDVPLEYLKIIYYWFRY